MAADRSRRTIAAAFLWAAAVAFAAVILAMLTGGVEWRRAGWRGALLSLRDPWRPLAAGVVLAVGSRLVAGAGFGALLRRFIGPRDRLPARSAAVVAACAFVFAAAWTSRAAGGSDSSCYALQAEAFAHGRATLVNPVARLLPDLPNAVFAPTGFIPSPRSHGAAVPICGPGLALLMVPAFLIHRDAIFVVVPVTAALLVWLTFLYGRRVDGDVTALCAALLLACSPIFLYQAVQPMSDVPAAAAWMAALVAMARGGRKGQLAGGVCAAVAVVIRANLAPLVLLLPLSEFRLKAEATRAEATRAEATRNDTVASAFRRNAEEFVASAFRRNLFFVAALAPAVAVLLALNAVRYGAPLASGYGAADVMFSPAHVAPNLARYPWWVLDTQTPLLLLVFGIPWWLAGRPEKTRLVAISLAAVALLGGTYLLYTVFDDWWYVRFLLPALPILIVLSVAVLRRLTAWLPSSGGSVIVAAVIGAVCWWQIHIARERHATDLQRLESRFRLTGAYAARELPATAVVLAVQQSGSIRFHGQRDTLAWDQIPPGALDGTIARLRAAGRALFLALEESELEPFRQRFGGRGTAVLDGSPAAIIRAPVRVLVYVIP